MMLQYNNNNIISKFIKNLLYTTYIPIVNTVNHGSFLIANNIYVYETNFIKCTKTGYLGGKYTQDENGNDLFVDRCEFENIHPYEFGVLYNKFTENFLSTSNYYDSETHVHLGKLLRCLRDVKGIDLMPYYNLYSDDYISNYRISENGLMEYYSSTYKILRVPIKFNQKYTIAIDCPSSIWICPAFFSKGVLLEKKRTSTGTPVDMTARLQEYGKYSTFYNTVSFKNPIVYEVKNTSLEYTYDNSIQDCEYFNDCERCLYLLIQLPSTNNSSIVILEGDYSDISESVIMNEEELYKLHDFDLNELLCSNLSLLQFNTKNSYVFSNRLIEYLLMNVVTPEDKYAEDIELMQNLLPNNFYASMLPGIWNNILRYRIYNFARSNPYTTNLDLNGFVDKDSEKLLFNQMFRYN